MNSFLQTALYVLKINKYLTSVEGSLLGYTVRGLLLTFSFSFFLDKINNNIVLPGFYKTTKIQEIQKKAETRVEEGERAQGREPVKDRMASWELNLYFINIPAANWQ